ncbi:MAG: hypothetical protein HRU40_16740, partial [Saprospiraceae bacterium]|nr:hypothetical protein [Saprospiraceae bacterium]
LPDEDLQNVLRQLWNDAAGQVDDFRDQVQQWYDNVMDRASGWYKRNIQQILILVGLSIAVVFNADTIAIYERLESDPEAVEQIIQMAEMYVTLNGDSLILRDDPTIEASLVQIRTLIDREIDQAAAPLGLGWKGVDWQSMTWAEWAMKFLGWIVTALAVSLGAPFWFDLLKKLVNIRGSGRKPDANT